MFIFGVLWMVVRVLWDYVQGTLTSSLRKSGFCSGYPGFVFRLFWFEFRVLLIYAQGTLYKGFVVRELLVSA